MRNILRVKWAPAGLAMASLLVWTTGSAPEMMAQNSTQSNTAPAASSTPPNSAPSNPQPSSTPPSSAESPSPQTATPAPSSSTSSAPQASSMPPGSAEDNSTQPAADSAAPAPNSSDKMPGVKPGSIDDVNAVGNRDIGGRGVGNWYSTESEIKMGKQYASELEKSVKFITDPVVDEYVNRIGQNLVKNSDAKVPFTIKVIDSDEVNAMALPGGFFYVNSGLILTADDEAELAGVMAHEIAHVAAHHVAREQTRMNYAQLGTIPLIFIGGWTGYGIYEAANIGIPLTFLQFSRDFETQADFLGVQYMYRTGYDPEAFVTIFEKLENLEKTKPNVIAKAFSTHPQTPDRIEATQKEIATLLPPREEYVVNTSEFNDVKARLARIENKRNLKNGQNGNQPTLRRANTSNNDSTSPDSQGDDRPTLERRDNTN
ncbi:MAG TPA: M48 family metallopeptidase [Acidobacteriaceae bacterium]|nr:M48 family metallopeptidase [Acidobacteriaceae bacterium]